MRIDLSVSNDQKRPVIEADRQTSLSAWRDHRAAAEGSPWADTVHGRRRKNLGFAKVRDALTTLVLQAAGVYRRGVANAIDVRLSEVEFFFPNLPAGFDGKPYRQTDGAVFSVVEGRGSVSVERGDGKWNFDFSARDHFVIPSWHTARFKSEQGCVLFSFSDRPVHQALGIHAEERMVAG